MAPSKKDYTDILHFIAYYILVHGYSPSVRDIRDGTGVKSTNTVNYALDRLEEDGKITREPKKSRTIVLLEII